MFFRAHDSVKDTVKKFSSIGGGAGSPEGTKKVSQSKPPAAGKALDSSARAKKEKSEIVSDSASQPKWTPAGEEDSVSYVHLNIIPLQPENDSTGAASIHSPLSFSSLPSPSSL